MSDDKTNRGAQDRARINVNEDYELQYWSKKWGISAAELKQVVDQVGPMSKDVAAKLGKSV